MVIVIFLEELILASVRQLRQLCQSLGVRYKEKLLLSTFCLCFCIALQLTRNRFCYFQNWLWYIFKWLKMYLKMSVRSAIVVQKRTLNSNIQTNKHLKMWIGNIRNVLPYLPTEELIWAENALFISVWLAAKWLLIDYELQWCISSFNVCLLRRSAYLKKKYTCQ